MTTMERITLQDDSIVWATSRLTPAGQGHGGRKNGNKKLKRRRAEMRLVDEERRYV